LRPGVWRDCAHDDDDDDEEKETTAATPPRRRETDFGERRRVADQLGSVLPSVSRARLLLLPLLV
jgi:hypothetical protein